MSLKLRSCSQTAMFSKNFQYCYFSSHRAFTSQFGDRPDKIDVGIILTDGKSNNEAETMSEALAARKVSFSNCFVGLKSILWRALVLSILDIEQLCSWVSRPESIHRYRRSLLLARPEPFLVAGTRHRTEIL